MEQKLVSAREELTQLQAKNAELQKAHEKDRADWLKDKKTLEETVYELSTSEQSTEADRTSREEAIRHQEERAKAAEDKYSREIIAHGESRKLAQLGGYITSGITLIKLIKSYVNHLYILKYQFLILEK